MFDFPATPTLGQKFPVAPTAGQVQYTWDGEKWTTLGAQITSAPPGSALPLASAPDAVVGTSAKYSREDHVHPAAAVSSSIPEPPQDNAPYIRRATTLGGSWSPAIGHGTIWGAQIQINSEGATTFTVTTGEAFSGSPGISFLMKTNYLAKGIGPFVPGDSKGGLDTGTFSGNNWYCVYLIAKDDGTSDVCYSTASPAPQMPAGFTWSRRIGMVLSNVAGTGFRHQIQYGNTFMWTTPIKETLITSMTTYASAFTATAPGLLAYAGSYAFGTVVMKVSASGPSAHHIFGGALDYANSVAADGSTPVTVIGAANTTVVAPWESPFNPANPMASLNGIHSNSNADTIQVYTRGWIDGRQNFGYP